jgi:uncharacterized protein YutE (UPF0331/DUF86 family)
MKPPDLFREINLEKENLRIVLSDIERAQKELASPNPSPTILAGAASYIAQCYGGIESILKRIIRNRNAELPSGGEWHIELLKLFSKNSGSPFGILDENLFSQLSLMRKFRHVVMHGYGFTLDGEMVITALKETPVVVSGFLSALDSYLKGQEDSK